MKIQSHKILPTRRGHKTADMPAELSIEYKCKITNFRINTSIEYLYLVLEFVNTGDHEYSRTHEYLEQFVICGIF